MKAIQMRANLIVALVGVIFAQVSAASVFTNSVFLVNHGNTGPNSQPSYEIQTYVQPNGVGDGAYVWVTINGSLVLSPYSSTVGIGQEWFSVTNGTAFDASALSTATPFANNLGPPFNPGQIQLSMGTNFFLAFVQIEGFTNQYGWVHLQYTESSLTLLGNAIENSGSGIIVGTMTVVPEPNTLMLTGLSLVLLVSTAARLGRCVRPLR
jgi:hypothetical protein